MACFFNLAAQSTGEKIPDASAWYTGKSWLNGLKLQPHDSTNQQEFAKQYQAHKLWWDKAFAFLRDNNLDSLKPGKYVIDGDDVYADITDTPSDELDKSKWHSHRRYCDIQYVIRGAERVGVAPLETGKITIPFTDKGDSQFYTQDMKGEYYLGTPDVFFIFFPTEIHRPFIKVAESGPVKRIRFKIRSRE